MRRSPWPGSGSRAPRVTTLGAVLVVASLVLASCATWPSSSPSVRGLVRTAPSPGAVAPGGTTLHPFGKLSCSLQPDGIRFCQGNGTTDRVPSFDGVPLDADLALPGTGSGPFPLIVMLHGLGGSKSNWETTAPTNGINDLNFAKMGYAVLTYTARGFGQSCGTSASRQGTPGCDKGWIRLADQRYEIRDTQRLAGMLVDEGIVKPSIAVTGVSYGGGQALELAMLKNRVRLPNGNFVPWVSPSRHVPMQVGAAYAEWPWDSLATALDPNGAQLDSTYTRASADVAPAGAEKQSWNSLLYTVTTFSYLAPPGVDPGADLTNWYNTTAKGEPYGASSTAILKELSTYHSAIGIPMPAGGPSPTVMQNGWTDTLFPVSEALHWSNRYRVTGSTSPLLQIFDDVGHGWAQGKSADVAMQTAKAISFLNDVMIAHTKPPTGVIAVGTTCPSDAASGPTLRATSWSGLAAGQVTLSGAASQTVKSGGGDPTVASKLNPAYGGGPYCDPLSSARESGTAIYSRSLSTATTLVGGLHITAHLKVVGPYPELVGRLWDVNPTTGTRQLIEGGVYRPAVNQSKSTTSGTIGQTDMTLDLAPNEYTVPAGHEVELELVGSTAPWFRKSNGTFKITVTAVSTSIGRS